MCFSAPSISAPPPAPAPVAPVQSAAAPAQDTSSADSTNNLPTNVISGRTNLDATRVGKNRLRIDLGATGDTGNTNGLSIPA